jgi:hypothetical protein
VEFKDVKLGEEFSPFSSSFSVFFRNFFHHDANSRFDGGETAECAAVDVGAAR